MVSTQELADKHEGTKGRIRIPFLVKPLTFVCNFNATSNIIINRRADKCPTEFEFSK